MQAIKKQRELINKIDKQILRLFKSRFAVIKRVSRIKVKHDLPVKDKKRINEMLKVRLKIAKKYKIPLELVKNIFKNIIYYSMKEEKNG